MDYNFHSPTWTTYNLNSAKLSSQSLFFTPIYFLLKFCEIVRVLSRSLDRCVLSQQIFLGLLFGLLLITSYSSLALTTKTLNVISGNAPYLIFDGGQTRVTNSEELLGISLSDGRKFTPATPNSSINPIELPVAGQSFANIGMSVPTNTDSIALSSLIGPPYNYWGDDDGDGQGVSGITATGSLSLSIVDKNNQAVSRNTVLTICNAPYKLTLSNSEATLKTRYGVPNESRFSARDATYYVNPKAKPEICFAKPNYFNGNGVYAGPTHIWDIDNGFLTQSVMPSSYDLNFPTTGAHNLYFDLNIAGINQVLYWEPVSHGGITATMTSPTKTSVHVTLTGPAVMDSSQQISDNPTRIDMPSLPQVFELVGRDSPGGNVIVKYGFVLKQWFVSRGSREYSHSSTSSWCTKIGDYRLPIVKDLTNATCQGSWSSSYCKGAVGATPSSPNNTYQRRIGAGFFTEWGCITDYSGTDFYSNPYWTGDANDGSPFAVSSCYGYVTNMHSQKDSGICVYP